jgi:hypothetical protein
MQKKPIRTTINFVQSRLDLVIETAKINDISYKDLISRCINLYIQHWENDSFCESALKYQDDHPEWRKVHFKMSPEEYDVYFDLKKVSRCSFSLIVATAIDLYLEIAVGKYQEFSYPVDTYEKLCILVEKRPIYLFSWVKTDKIAEISEILRE